MFNWNKKNPRTKTQTEKKKRKSRKGLGIGLGCGKKTKKQSSYRRGSGNPKHFGSGREKGFLNGPHGEKKSEPGKNVS